MLSEEKIKSDAGGALGYSPADISIVSRRTEGTNTYVALKGSDGKEFNYIINGGNLLTMGMTNPPSCARKGEPIKTSLLGGRIRRRRSHGSSAGYLHERCGDDSTGIIASMPREGKRSLDRVSAPMDHAIDLEPFARPFTARNHSGGNIASTNIAA